MSTPSAAIERKQRLAASLRELDLGSPRIAFVLGSGLGAFADRIEDARIVPYADIDGMPRSSVPGHEGRLVCGELAGVRVICQQGRVHLYEGWTVEEVTRCVRALVSIGVEAVCLTNAAGGANASFRVPSLMRVTDHLNFQGRSLVAPSEAAFGSPYDERLGEALHRAAEESGVELLRGVYAGLLGPTYETPAEVRMLRWMGADAIGMSTVNEALAARTAGARVAAISCITNLGAGITGEKLAHDEVVEAGARIADDFCGLLQAAIPHLAHELE